MDKDKLQEQLNRFIEHRQRRWKSPKSKTINLYYFKLLKDHLNGGDFTRDAILNFFNHLLDQGLSESTRRSAETAILGFTKWLFYEGVTDKNWTLNIDRTKIHPKPRILPSQSEILKLIVKATEPGRFDNVLTTFSKMEHRAYLSYIAVCGSRNNETAQIQRKDVSISGNQLEIVEGKGGARTAALPPIPWLLDELQRRVEGKRTQQELKVLSDRTHYKESDLDRLFVVNRTQAEQTMRKIKFQVHDLRRIFARDLKGNGADIDQVRDVMGHKSIDTTMRYLAYDTSTQAKTLKHFSTEARKYRTKEEKAKELQDLAWERGRIIEGNFDGKVLTMRVEIT